MKQRVTIDLPERLDMEENYEVSVTNLLNVRRAAEGKFKLSYLSFEKMTFISPTAALVLASEVDRWRGAVGDRVRARHKKWNPNVRQLLCEMGFFELLHLPRPPELGEVINTTFLPFMRANVEETNKGGPFAKELRIKIDQAAGTQIRKHLLYAGLTEAITNVSQHAYPKNGKATVRPWWMSAAYMRETNTVIVSFYDHGLTIPGTLPASKLYERMKDKFGLWNDGEKLKAAMQLGRSAVHADGRGKGLQNFLEIINAHPGSRLRIISNHGVLTVTNDGENGLSFDSSVVQTCLRGTLIEWQFVPKNATNDLHC